MKFRPYAFLGLAAKAGKVVSGEERCEKAVKEGFVKLIIVSRDASDNTKRKFKDLCKYKGVDFRIFGEKILLGKYIGKDMRAVIGILDVEFSKQLIKLIDDQSSGIGGV